MRRINLDTEVTHVQVDGGSHTFTKGCAPSLIIDLGQKLLQLQVCLSNEEGQVGGASQQGIRLLDMDSTRQQAVKDAIDGILLHLQEDGKMPPGALEDW